MRRIMMFNRVTADGYFAAADGNLGWVVPDDELDRAAAQGIPSTGTILFGRRTYEMFEAFWPHALEDSSTPSDPHSPDRRSESIQAMGRFINSATKLVFSRTLNDLTWENARLLGEFDPSEVAALKQQAGQDMIIFGSGSIVTLLTQHGLIDEYQFVVSPLLLGSGRSLIDGLPTSLKLELVESTPYPSGNVVLRYVKAG